MIVTLLTEHHLEFLSLKEGCRGSSESTHVKMSHCWKSHVVSSYYVFAVVRNKYVGQHARTQFYHDVANMNMHTYV